MSIYYTYLQYPYIILICINDLLINTLSITITFRAYRYAKQYYVNLEG